MSVVMRALFVGRDPQLTAAVTAMTALERSMTVSWTATPEPEAPFTADVIVVDEQLWTGGVRSQLEHLRAQAGNTPIVLLCSPETAMLGAARLGVSAVELVDKRHVSCLLPGLIARLGASGARPGPVRNQLVSEPAAERELAHVLLVEDNEADVVLTQALLQETDGLQFHMHAASNGELALQRLLDVSQPGIDLILLDINMPLMDGFTFLRALREQPQLAHMPVIMCSTSDEPGDLTKARAFDVAAYVTKPVRLDQLEPPLRAVASLIVSRAGGSPRLERR